VANRFACYQFGSGTGQDNAYVIVANNAALFATASQPTVPKTIGFRFGNGTDAAPQMLHVEYVGNQLDMREWWQARRQVVGLVTINEPQPLDADLTAIAGLSPADNDVIQRKSGAWTNRTPAQLKTDLSLTKADVGLANVDNTSDANKPISNATQTALDTKPSSADIDVIDIVTQAEYDAIVTKDPRTLYVVVG
jgi:hypothetical protein